MPFAFSEIAVIATYHEEFPSDYKPTVEDLHDWDDQLVQTYASRLEQVLAEFQVAITRENKSRVLMLAVASNGADGSLTQIRNACRYFQHTSGLDLDVEPDA